MCWRKRMDLNFFEALEARYKAEIAEAVANINVYRTNPVGIGEHPDLVAAIDSQVERIAHAEDKLSVLKAYFL